ncbi:O-antigen ligase family protein [Sporolactobacillus kofuensis]|uniref:O-antigen ligase family protein n=1 Tax=Sporolactobacillus kofuensis TaxID=269672 RepID=A0ABW1WDB9_9BACL|nr:hypothetical protein [Sporolactobacillus kofuensis]MCO7176714.1 hypothetical protein [Sporolactobacillus kofuensis]
MLNYFFEFITFTFPKAGVQIGVPITIAMFLFLFALIKCQLHVISAINQIKGLSVSYVLFACSVLLAFVINLGSLSSFQITAAMVVFASPLAIGIGRSMDAQKAIKILAFSLIIVGSYALIQRIAGIVATAIPGLTYTFGQDLADKPIGFGMAISGEAQKMPSTYQNGNGVGLFYAMGIPFLLSWFPLTMKQKVLKYAAIVFGLVGLFLSGSRSIMIPFVIFLIFILMLVKNKLNDHHQLLFLAAVLFISGFGILYLIHADSSFLQQAYARYMQQTISDPTGAGRTLQYASAFSQINHLTEAEFLRFLIVGLPWDEINYVEGLFYSFQMYGIFGFIGFLGIFISAIISVYKQNDLAAIGMICVLIAFMIDGSFLYPPAVMNYFFLVGLALAPKVPVRKKHAKNFIIRF